MTEVQYRPANWLRLVVHSSSSFQMSILRLEIHMYFRNSLKQLIQWIPVMYLSDDTIANRQGECD